MSRSAGKNGLWAALGVAAGGLSTWGYYASLLQTVEESLAHTKRELTAAEDSKRVLQAKYDALFFEKTQGLTAARNSQVLSRFQQALVAAENSKHALQVDRDALSEKVKALNALPQPPAGDTHLMRELKSLDHQLSRKDTSIRALRQSLQAEERAQNQKPKEDTVRHADTSEPSQVALQKLKDELSNAKLYIRALRDEHAQHEKERFEHRNKIALLEESLNIEKGKNKKKQAVKPLDIDVNLVEFRHWKSKDFEERGH